MFDASLLPGPRTEGWRHGKINQLAGLPEFHADWSIMDGALEGQCRVSFHDAGICLSEDLMGNCQLGERLIHPDHDDDVHGHLLNGKQVPFLEIKLANNEALSLDFSGLHNILPLQINIIVGDGCSSSITLSNAGPNASLWLRMRVMLGNRANLQFMQHDVVPSRHRLFDLEVDQSDHSVFALLSLSPGGQYVRDEVTCRLAAHCRADLFSGHHLCQGAHRDLRLRVDHMGPQSQSNQDVRCVVHDRAVSGFDGLIHVAEAGAQTTAYQESKVVLMEDGALHHGKPELEIFQDDVVCSHGAAIGHLDKDALFYLMSRGIAEENARNMLLEAFFSGLVEAATPHLGALTPKGEEVLSLAKGLAS